MKGTFPKFVKFFASHMRQRYPFIEPLDRALGGRLPKASTFYVQRPSEGKKCVFLNLQPSQKAWEVGQFTVNVQVSDKAESVPHSRLSLAEFQALENGQYRLNSVAAGRDKWWCLLPPGRGVRTSEGLEYWRAPRYDNDDVVFHQAFEDVRTDLETHLFGVIGLTNRRSGP